MKKSLVNRKYSSAKVGLIFVMPLVLIMGVFLLFPILKAGLMSFQYWYIPKPKPEGNYFVGFENYLLVLKDPYFLSSLVKTGIYIIVTVVGRYLLGMGSAILLNQKFPGRSIARGLLIIPWAIPEVVACLIWILMYDRDYGLINYILQQFRLLSEPAGFLSDPNIALPSAMAVNIWKGFPFVGIMLLAGLQSIPGELYEATKVDGANSFEQFRHITLPLLKPVSGVVFLLLIIWTIKDFGIAYLLAKGGPSRATEILTIYVYQSAFKFFDFGKAAASGIIMLIFSMVFTYFYLKSQSTEVQ
ncbi:MAG: multiple sugar transport system permease protein [Clostridiales bacterium]|nr:multiple sugar transport system permease protein [Clostridiales bacterium]